MIGKLRSKMEEERKKIETKKEKEGMFCDEVSEILAKHIMQKLQSSTNLVDLLNHATELDELSNRVVNLFNQRDKLIRQLTTNIHLLAQDLKTNASQDTKRKLMNKIDTLLSADYDQLDLKGAGGDLKNNLVNYQSKNTLVGNQRKSIATTISPEEISRMKVRLVSMIKTEQEEKPFKKVLKKKLAKYEQRLKTRNLKAMKTEKFDSDKSPDQENIDENDQKRMNDEFEEDNDIKPVDKSKAKRRMTMIKKQKSRGKLLQ